MIIFLHVFLPLLFFQFFQLYDMINTSIQKNSNNNLLIFINMIKLNQDTFWGKFGI